MRRAGRVRVRPMWGRGRHGAYPRATWRETFGTLRELSGLVTKPREVERPWER